MSETAKTKEKAQSQLVQPSLHYDQIKFSDGTAVDLEADDIIVLVGPNNAGKSAAIRELYDGLGVASPSKVVKATSLKRNGTAQDVRAYIVSISRVAHANGMISYSGPGYTINDQHIDLFWKNNLSQFRGIFTERIETEKRITDSNPASIFDVLKDVPNHPIQKLYVDDRLEEKINSYFKRAFGKELILERGAGSQLPLRVGAQPAKKKGEDRVSFGYLERLRQQTVPLHEQGDGMRSFTTVLLRLLSSDAPRILLLDEPEAFLHPPQARLLGEFIARERPKNSQLFVATHSADVLQGMLGASPQGLKLIRIQRDGMVNRTRLLDKVRAKKINTDPLMRYSGAVSGIFHQRVIVTESGADSMFYAALLDLPSIHGHSTPDVMFVDGGGKHRLGAIAGMLRSLDVTVDVVADFDLLNDIDVFMKIVVALGGTAADFEPSFISLKSAIDGMKPPLSTDEVVAEIRKSLKGVSGKAGFPKNNRKLIEALFKKTSPWEAIKHGGDAAIPTGEPRKHYDRIVVGAAKIGLWIVPVGEMERFVPSIGGHGPKWVQEVLETFDLANSDQLERARNFVKRIWDRT